MGIEITLSRALMEAHPEDAARVLEGMPEEQAAAGMEPVSAETAASVLERMEPMRAAACLKAIPGEKAGEILELLPVEVSGRVLRKLDPSDRERLLEGASERTSLRIRRILELPERTAAQLMDPMVTALPEDLEAGEALRRVRRESRSGSYYVYVTDRLQRLVGVITLRRLMLAPSKRSLASLMNTPVARLNLRDSYNGILRHPGWGSFHALPVVDGKGGLVGVLRYDALRRLEAEMAAGKSEDLLFLGTTLAGTWVAVTAAMLDGLAATLRGSGIPSRREAEEGRDDP